MQMFLMLSFSLQVYKPKSSLSQRAPSELIIFHCGEPFSFKSLMAGQHNTYLAQGQRLRIFFTTNGNKQFAAFSNKNGE